jgi:hypothetical protein
VRFDDSLDTVLTAEVANPAAIQMMWRQAVDLIGRRRGGRREGAIARLYQIRGDVPLAVRAASARGLERVNPPADLAALFLVDDPAVATPVARSVRLSANEWLQLLPEMHPVTRGILRNRRDLPEQVVRGLESFGPTDLALPAAEGFVQPADTVPPSPASEPTMEDLAAADVEDAPTTIYHSWGSAAAASAWPPVVQPQPEPEVEAAAAVWPPVPVEEPQPIAAEAPIDEPAPAEPSATWPPVVAEAPSEPVQPEPRAEWPPVTVPEAASAPEAADVEEPTPPARAPWPPATVEPSPAPTFVAPEPLPFVAVADIARELPVVAEAMRRERAEDTGPPPAVDPDFQIAELVARIEAHSRTAPPPAAAAPAPRHDPAPSNAFRFETDAAGVIRWCEGVDRGPVIGLSLAAGRDGAPATADGGAAGALARRARFSDARLTVPGASPAAGAWRISATPAFDHASGRFTGYRGTARRPRADEEPRVGGASPATDSLRQLVHELRTPANAISGFAEMIAHEMLGPVPPAYREQAAAIRDQTAGLLGAIDDLDTAARLESRSLDLRSEAVPLPALLGRIVGDLRPLGDLRGSRLALDVGAGAVVAGDARAVERLFSRLLAALLSNAAQGETIAGDIRLDGDAVRCDFTRPARLASGERALFSPDAEIEAQAEGGPLLGAGFAFRLAQRLATELGGALVVGAERLTLRLPAAVSAEVEQATV